MTTEVAKTIASSIISTRLDYCNSLLNNTPMFNLQKIQRLQNNLARIVLCRPRGSNANKLWIELHWLPIAYRVQYKTALLTFKALHTGQPGYIADLLTGQPFRETRSTGQFRLLQLVSNSKTTSRGFSFSAPTVWNNLPTELRLQSSLDSFKPKLKIYYFKAAYVC